VHEGKKKKKGGGGPPPTVANGGQKRGTVFSGEKGAMGPVGGKGGEGREGAWTLNKYKKKGTRLPGWLSSPHQPGEGGRDPQT